MRFHIITLFPTAFDSYLGESIIKRAIEDKKISVTCYNPRDFVDKKNKFKHIDKPPYAGGPGMVIQAEPVIRAVEKAIENSKSKDKKKSKIKTIETNVKIIWLSPHGKQFDTIYAKKTTKKYTDIIIICGRYEGIDAREKKAVKIYGKVEELSIGPFVLTGGELPAMILIDCMSRQVEGVLGNFNSREEERTASANVYTRPEVFEHNGKKYTVPKVLLSGDHKKIEEWRKNH